jgi:antitoxin YefM
MRTITATCARKEIFHLLEDVDLNHEPVQITGKKTNAILISESDWNAIQETLYLLSVPGMRESLIEGMNTPIDQCSDELSW